MTTTSESGAAGAGLSTRPEPAGAPPLGVKGFMRWCWRQLTSMRTALVLLFLLALAAIPGSVFPQRGTDPIKVNEYLTNNPRLGPIADRLGMFEVYSSPWFAAIYLLLFISLIGCVVPRIAQHWRAVRARPPAAPRNLSRLPEHVAWQGPATTTAQPDVALEAAAAYLRSRRWRVDTAAYDGTPRGGWVAAEKGYLRETGNLVFHLALVGILVAVAYGGLFGWKGNVIVKEGSGFSNTLTQYDAWGGGRFVDPAEIAPFSFTLDTFTVEFERGTAQRGAPRVFEAAVTYRPTPDAAPQQRTIEVNEPLVVDGAKVFLVGHGYAPHIIVRDRSGTVVFDDSVPFLPQDGNFTSTGVVKVPDARPQFGIQGIFAPTAVIDDIRGPHSTFPAPDDPAVFLSAWFGDLGLDSGVPQSVYRLDTTKMTQLGLKGLRPGQTWQLPDGDGSVEFAGFERWASFQIAYDPGKELALGAAAVAIAGLMLSLFVRRRRVFVRVSAAPAGDGSGVGEAPGPSSRTLIEVAGLDRSESGTVRAEVEELAAAVRAAAPAGADTPGHEEEPQ